MYTEELSVIYSEREDQDAEDDDFIPHEEEKKSDKLSIERTNELDVCAISDDSS